VPETTGMGTSSTTGEVVTTGELFGILLVLTFFSLL
jgi:hypothetical protein